MYSPGPERVVDGPGCVGGREVLSFLESVKIGCSCDELNTNSIEYPRNLVIALNEITRVLVITGELRVLS